MSKYSRFEYAELLIAIWKLGAPHDPLPITHGMLDRALEGLPETYRNGLTFGMTSVGRRCFELPDILMAARVAMLINELDYITLSEGSARQIVVRNGLSTAEAREIGKAIKATVDELRQRWLINKE